MKTISECDRAIKLNPKDDVAYADRGAVYASMGQYDKAIEDGLQALALCIENEMSSLTKEGKEDLKSLSKPLCK